MAKVACECGKSFKNDSALGQHRRDSPKHREKAEPSLCANATASSNPINAAPQGQPPKEPSTVRPVPFLSRYSAIQFVRAGESSGTAATSQKKTKSKKSSGTGTMLRPVKFTAYGRPYIQGLGNEDWSICDKDCGWCGHCADHLYL